MSLYLCAVCNSSKPYNSYGALHRHKSLKHPELLNIKQPLYEDAPKYCQECTAAIPYAQRRNKFCSSRCSSIASNRSRDKTLEKQRKLATWADKPKSDKNVARRASKIPRSLLCEGCKTHFTPSGNQRFCKPTCNKTRNGKINYRNLCRFKLNIHVHRHLYNLELLESNQWYRPSNSTKGGYNPKGVTWDHLYRVEDGFLNSVDPSIMSHPANAEMVTWEENIRRRASSITLKELLIRIENYSSSSTRMYIGAA